MTREEAIEVISQDIPCEHDTDLIEALNMAINALENIASVKEVSKGKWIPNAGLLGTRYSCSVCRSWSTFNDNYCSNCGAEMIKGE